MEEKDRKRGVVFHIAAAVYSAVILCWFFLPFFIPSMIGIKPFSLPSELYGSSPDMRLQFLLMKAALYFVLFVCAVMLISPFLVRKVPSPLTPEHALPALLIFFASALNIIFLALHLFRYATSPAYFSKLSEPALAAAAGSIAVNAYAISLIIALASRRNENYREYLEFKRVFGKGEMRGVKLVLKGGIQKKLIFSFIGLFMAIIAVLGSVLMADFSRTILNAVFSNASSLTDRTASIIKANIGDEVAIEEYMAIEKKKNENARFRFNSLSFFQRRRRTNNFVAEASTDENLLRTKLSEDYSDVREPVTRYNAGHRTYEFAAPVVLSNTLIGYVLVDYDRELIFEPYFRTQIKVVSISALFLYLSVFLIYVFGTNIVHPILFLRMSVNKISSTLSSMIKGRVRISAELLRYEDRVPTRDEIKSLSGEIDNMTTVIKGIIPYISASTLKQAEKAQPSSRAKELAFLFTDVRGFTTICEGMEPEEVVRLLNRYLELQSNIILENHGDVDKFVGDEIMAMFDGPRKELNACKASMDIRTAMAREREARALEQKQTVSIGIGINAGQVVFGSVGAKDRMDFTSIGDTVNLAARLEGANKTYGTKALVTEMVYEKIKDAYLCREVDLLTVKGKTKPVRIYEIFQERKKADQKLFSLTEQFERGLSLYRQRKWDQAQKAFGTLADAYSDEPSAVFMRRIKLFRSNPPPRVWDGVFSLTVK